MDRKSAKRLSGPNVISIIKNLFQVRNSHISGVLTNWSNKYGKVYTFRMFNKKCLVITSSRHIENLFASDKSCPFSNDRAEYFITKHVLGDVSVAFSPCSYRQQALKSLHSGILSTYARNSSANKQPRRFVESVHQNAGKDTNLDGVLRKFLLEDFTSLLLGETLSDSDPDKDCAWEFIDLLYELIEPSVDRALRTFPFLRYLPGCHGNLYRKAIFARDKVAKRFFEDQKASFNPVKVRGLVDVCLMRQQEDIAKNGDTWLTDEFIKGLIYDTLAAGMTELMKSIRLFMLLMCHHQDVQTRLQAEIDSIIGTERFPEISDRKWMPYTEAVTLELWRYGSQTPLAIPHKCRKDVTLDGYLIEAGSIIFPNLYGVHHDEDLWGDPWNFRPERFLDERGNLLPADHKFLRNVIPFSLGKRACPGQDFARSRIFITITSLLQRVRLWPPDNSELPSADPRDYTKKYPLTEPQFECQIVSRENIII